MNHIDHATTRLQAALAELDVAWKEYKSVSPTSGVERDACELEQQGPSIRDHMC